MYNSFHFRYYHYYKGVLYFLVIVSLFETIAGSQAPLFLNVMDIWQFSK